jgi:hypothetical protein
VAVRRAGDVCFTPDFEEYISKSLWQSLTQAVKKLFPGKFCAILIRISAFRRSNVLRRRDVRFHCRAKAFSPTVFTQPGPNAEFATIFSMATFGAGKAFSTSLNIQAMVEPLR